MAEVTAIILTKNEEKNIEDCIISIKKLVKRIVVIDSYSIDKTTEIAKINGAEVYNHPFENYSKQFNWGIDNTNIKTKWILRIDADERFTPELCGELESLIEEHSKDDINGIVIEAWLYFMGKKLKYGGSRKKKLMLFKTGIGRIEERRMDEHTVLSKGQAVIAKNKFLHIDYKDLNTFVKKLNWYATREMQDYFECGFSVKHFNANDKEIEKTRLRKMRYYKAPMFIRCWLLFLYKFFIRGNWRNGKEGMIYSMLYHLFYRLLVDAKIYEQIKFPKEFEETGDLK